MALTRSNKSIFCAFVVKAFKRKVNKRVEQKQQRDIFAYGAFFLYECLPMVLGAVSESLD
jgi:hypothetical protein